MAFIGRKTLKSERARTRQIDRFFEQVAYLILLCYSIFVFVSWLSLRPSLQVHLLTIEGVHAVDKDAVSRIVEDGLSRRFLSFVARNNSIFYPRSMVLGELHMLDTRIADVSLVFDTRNNLRLTIREYNPALLYCRDDVVVNNRVSASTTDTLITTDAHTATKSFTDCYFADERGYIFAHAPEWNGYPYVTFIASSSEDQSTHTTLLHTFILPESEYAHVRAFLSILEKINLHPRVVTILPDHDFRIGGALPWDMLWTSEIDPQKSTDNLALVLRSLNTTKGATTTPDFHLIDLRFGNKIFYK